MRILFYTGKGGVGKTTISACTASYIASLGKKVLLISTDQAHSLEDSLNKKIYSISTKIDNNFDAMEIDAIEEGNKVWKNLQDYLKEIIKNRANYGIEADEALVFPGLEEVFSLLCILEIYEKNDYDVLVVDCAPTGQSLSMLTYAEKIRMVADAVIPMVKNINSIFGNFISRKTSVPKPKEIMFNEASKLIERLNKLYEIMKNQDITSVRIVTTLEKIVLEEAKKNYSWLKMYGFNVDAVYLNKIYPLEALDGYFNQWNNWQQKNLELAKQIFSEEQIFNLYLQNSEIFGKNYLKKISYELYDKIDPTKVFCRRGNFKIEEKNGSRILVVNFSGMLEEIKVFKENEDLIIRYLNEERRFHLPEKLKRREISEYYVCDGVLKITFNY